MVDVFISYSREDEEKVGMLARMIASEGYQVWWDADLPPHMSYGDVITAKIGAAKAAVVVWSDTAAKSEWVRAEADVARNQKKLIQTSIDDIIPPLPFNQIQCASIGDWNGEADHRGWSKVKESLEALCGPRGEAASGEIDSSPSAESKPQSPKAPPPKEAPKAARRGVKAQSSPPKPRPYRAKAPAGMADGQAKQGLSTPIIIALGCGGLAILTLIALAVLIFIGASQIEETGDSIDRITDIPPPISDENPSPPDQPDPAPDGDYIPQVEPQAAPVQGEAVPLIATVEDPDGFSYVRQQPNADSEIINSVAVGERFLTYQQAENWWIVTTQDGTIGYIYADRIRVIGPAQ